MIYQKQSESITEIIFSHFEGHLNNISLSYKKAKNVFMQRKWGDIQNLRIERIGLYDMMIEKTIEDLNNHLDSKKLNSNLWLKVKSSYIKKIYNHSCPELAETFYNSVFCHLYHRRYYGNEYIFVQPVFATKYLDIVDKNLSYQCLSLIDSKNEESEQTVTEYKNALKQMVLEQFKEADFIDLEKDLIHLEKQFLKFTKNIRVQLNFHIRFLNTLFFRNKAAYLVCNLINGEKNFGFLVMFSNNHKGIRIRSLIAIEEQIDWAFSSSRANFTVDCLCSSAIVSFLNEILPFKKFSELYSTIGLHKQGKNEFYRDFLQHIKHSNDQFIPAPGIRGMVMSVFTLPSYPFVFKIIRDKFDQAKNITRKKVREKYQLVKYHDRAGRMIDTLEFSDVAFPLNRFSDDLLNYLKQYCPNSLEISGNQIVIKHIYIEKRVFPLNLYLKRVNPNQVEKIIIEYGNAIKDLAKTNIFIGDMFIKNFGVNQLGNVVLYDYDDIEYITDCNFRKLPSDLSFNNSFFIGEYDVFPEQFVHFLFSDKSHKEIFIKHHADLLTFEFWQKLQHNLKQGIWHFKN